MSPGQARSDIPTAGVAILVGDPPGLVLLSLRLPRGLDASSIDHQPSTIGASGREVPLLF
jgi:hypothetical protein